MISYSKLSKQSLWKYFKQDANLAKKTSYQTLTSAIMRDILETKQFRQIKKAQQTIERNLQGVRTLFKPLPVFTSPETYFAKNLFGGEPRWADASDSFMPFQQLYDLGNGQEGYISELLGNILYSTPIQSYPIDFSYYSEAGKFERRKTTSPKNLENYMNAVKGQNSDMSDEWVSNFIVIKNSSGWTPNKKPTVHSLSGQGNDMESCQVIDNEFIYCPPSGKCLLMCIYKAFPEIYIKYFQTLFMQISIHNSGKSAKMFENVQQLPTVNSNEWFNLMTNKQHEFGAFMKKNSIFRFNFAYKDLSTVQDLMKVKLNYYRTDNKKSLVKDISAKPKKYFKLRSPRQKGEAVLCIVNNHFIILKKIDQLIKCYRYALEHITWSPKTINDVADQETTAQQGQFDVQFNGKKIKYVESTKMFEDIYIYDLETFKRNSTGYFEPYAAGYANLDDFNRNYKKYLDNGDKSLLYTHIQQQQLDDTKCFAKMLFSIDSMTKKDFAMKPMTFDIYVDQCRKTINPKIPQNQLEIVKNKLAKTPDAKTIELLISVECKRKIILYAHNGAQFDSYFALQLDGINAESCIDKGGLMSLTLTSEAFNSTVFILRDSRKFIMGSLAQLCESFKVPSEFSKSSMHHEIITEDNWNTDDNIAIWKPYLDLDVISLSIIWIKFCEKMGQIVSKQTYTKASKKQRLDHFNTLIQEGNFNFTQNVMTQEQLLKLTPQQIQKYTKSESTPFDKFTTEVVDTRKYVTIAAMSYALINAPIKYTVGETTKRGIAAFSDPVVRKFITRANKGGRVIARHQKFRTKNIQEIMDIYGCTSLDQLSQVKLSVEDAAKVIKLLGDDYQVPFDATSLYASAMALSEASYLDAYTATLITNHDLFLDYNNLKNSNLKFIIEVDLFIPKELKFVPISHKTQIGNQFCTGHIKNIVINDVDYFELERFGITVTKVHTGIQSQPLVLHNINEFIEKFFHQRLLVKDTDSILGDLYKLIPNSSYGKFGQKQITTETLFTTQLEFETRSDVYTEDVNDFHLLENGQVCYTKTREESSEDKYSPFHIAGYILSYSKKIMNNFVLQMNAHVEDLISYMDTDSFYIHFKTYKQYLMHVKDVLGGGKNDYGEQWAIIAGDYLACKSKICYIICMETHLDKKTNKVIQAGTIKKKVTWKGISSSKFVNIVQDKIEQVKNPIVKLQEVVTSKGTTTKTTLVDPTIDDIQFWNRKKQTGVIIENTSKKLSIQEYLKKYNLVNGIYEFHHLE